jgi:stage II sporulation protein D
MRGWQSALSWIAAAVVSGPGGAARADVQIRVLESGGRVHAVPLEQYVERSVAAEAYGSWPPEVLKAQAVVARTYALHERQRNRGQRHDLDSSVLTQRYARAPVPAGVRAATRATRGQYLSFEGSPILAAFHASAGGRTASAAEVWGQDLPYLRSVDSPDDAAPDYFWSYEIDARDLRAALREAGYATEGGGEVRVLRRTPSGRVQQLEIGGARLSGRDLRQVLGGRAIRSARFELRAEYGVVRFLGSGAGHGVGMCQWGARQLALQGRTYAQILAHYYPGARLRGVAERSRRAGASGKRARP